MTSKHTYARWKGRDALSPAQQRALSILQLHGHHATSFQVLESGYQYWFDELLEETGQGAFVAYAVFAGCRVVAGPPVASPDALAAVTRRFLDDCEQAQQRAVFVSIEDSFVQRCREAGEPVDTLPIGLQPEWDPQSYSTDTPKHKTLRSQVRRAAKKGVEVRMLSEEEVAEDKGQLLAEIAFVVEQWKASRRMSPMQFMVALQPFHLPVERKYFVATQQRRAVGVLIAVPVYGRKGWFFEDVLRVPDAPNGTVEQLIDFAMREIQSEGSTYATLGLSPLVDTDVSGGPHRTKRRLMRWGFEHLGGLYQFKGLYMFKRRFVPHHWTPQFLATVGRGLGLRDLYAVSRALLGEGLLPFVWDTCRRLLTSIPDRVWSSGLLLFATLLVPWTILLALADGKQWFGDTSIHVAWIAFDIFLACSLFVLSALVKRATPSARTLSLFMAGTTLTDFILTTVQVFHLHQHATGWVLFFVVAGMFGPLLSTLFLLAFAFRYPTD